MNKGDLIRLTTYEEMKTEADYVAKVQKEYTNKHIDDSILNPDGVHRLRIQRDKIEYKDSKGQWNTIAGGSSPSFADVSHISVEGGDTEVEINWSDPDDVVIEGATFTTWAGTKLLRKEGSFPENENDGVLVTTNGVRNQYKDKPFVDSGLTNDKEYFYLLVPFSDDNQHTISEGNRFTATPKEGFVFGLKIDENNSNPKTAVTYIGENAGFTPADGINQSWGDWKPFVDEFLSEYVTLDLESKEETQKINPYNWTKTIDGGTAVLDGSKGDLMWKVPKLYWKFERKNTDLYIYLATMKVDNDYVCLAHTKGTKEMDYIYYSVMLGTEKSSKLRSIDGGTPTNDKTIGAFRTLCEANGTHVHMLPYYPWLLYQVIVLMLGKNRDTQTQFGNNQSSNQTNVAKNLSKGMIYGQSAKGSGVNLFIADPWGNQRFWIDGMKYDGSYNILVGTDEFNNNATGYENVGKTKSLNGRIDKVHGTTKSGFVPTSDSGSNSTYYADYGYVGSGYFPDAGGGAGDDLIAGAFCWNSYSASRSDSALSARIFVYGL